MNIHLFHLYVHINVGINVYKNIHMTGYVNFDKYVDLNVSINGHHLKIVLIFI